MARPVSRFPTEHQVQILKTLWRENRRLVVRELRETPTDIEGRDLAHTTVVATLHTMTDPERRHFVSVTESIRSRVERTCRQTR